MGQAETYVTLRITKPGVSADGVTAKLGIEPTHSHDVGDQKPRGTPYRHMMWSLSTKSQGYGPLSEHLATLLDRVEPKRAVLVEMAADRFEMDRFCFVSVEGNGGVVLQVDLLRRLAALPVVDRRPWAFVSAAVLVDGCCGRPE
ncbi:DUF4279 domain-containing protein [Dactylosporangium sp. CA-233914]|uniref:DUF4279 domain-containing protein n=1 Tax=Dactylosporangium sp. CA-233914 TaxID=3239934 RepID=UPI003D8F62BD